MGIILCALQRRAAELLERSSTAFHVASMLRAAVDTKWGALKILTKFLQHDVT
jgi:hypothetical protein